MSRRPTLLVTALAAAAALPVVVATPARAASTSVVINEVSVQNGARYLELRSLRIGAGQDVDLSGWSVWTCFPSYPGYRLTRLVTIPDGHVIHPNGYYLLAGSTYNATRQPRPDLLWWGERERLGFPSVRLVDDTGRVVDQVGTDSAATGNDPCVEKAKAAPVLTASAPDRFALGRSSAADTDDNARDFGDVQQTPQASGDRSVPARPPSPISMLRDGLTGGETHGIRAVVTGIDDRAGSSYDALYPEDRGLFVQEEPADHDADPATSEGIFVAGVARPSGYRPGDVVEVTGRVADKFGLRVISYGSSGTGEPLKVGTAAVPAPVEIDPARAASDGAAYFETLESMRVRLAEATANSGGTNKFGEVFVTPGAGRNPVFRTDTRKDVLGIADDAGAGNPANAYKDRRSTTRLEVDQFDRLHDVVGPLGYSFENYKVFPQPGALPRVVPAAGKQYPVRLKPARPGEIRIASFNVENFFPPGVPVGGPGTERTPQGVPTEEEYADQRAEILAALDDVLGRPDVVAVQEVYADAAGSTALADLADRLSRGNETYTAYVAKSNDSRGIANGYLVKSTVVASNPRLLGAADAGSCDGGKLFARPPFALDLDLEGRTLTLLNNHFKSKGGGGEECRAAQATFVRDRVREIEAAGGEAVVLGDLNAFEDEEPLAVLESDAQSSLTNLWATAPEQERYSYAFQGWLQTLDHMVVTEDVAASARDFRYVHVSTDYADREAGGKRVVDGHGLSDHNPPVLTIPTSLAAAPDAEVPEAPWAALLLVVGCGAAAAPFLRARRAG